jgi:rhodanese-related sulfurtransferase
MKTWNSLTGLPGLCLVTLLLCTAVAACDDEDGAETVEATLVEYDELVAWMATEEIVLIDVRTPTDFAAGHLQDAINVDLATLVDGSGELIDGGKALTQAAPDKDATLVAYCFGFGNDKKFAAAALELGYSDVVRYAGGTADWESHGNYFVIEYDGFKAWHDAKFPFGDGKNYLIDDLPVAWYTGDDPSHPGGHIPGAVNLPVELWADAEGNPVDAGKAFTDVVAAKEATVVIYCGNTTCGKSLMGVKAAVKLGYKKVYRYQGGWQEWQDKGNALKPGQEP